MIFVSPGRWQSLILQTLSLIHLCVSRIHYGIWHRICVQQSFVWTVVQGDRKACRGGKYTAMATKLRPQSHWLSRARNSHASPHSVLQPSATHPTSSGPQALFHLVCKQFLTLGISHCCCQCCWDIYCHLVIQESLHGSQRLQTASRTHSRQTDHLSTGACGRIFGQELKKPQSHRLSACKTCCLLFWPLGLEMSDTGRLFQASWLQYVVQKTAMTHSAYLEPPFFGCLCSFGIPKATCFSDLRTLPRSHGEGKFRVWSAGCWGQSRILHTLGSLWYLNRLPGLSAEEKRQVLFQRMPWPLVLPFPIIKTLANGWLQFRPWRSGTMLFFFMPRVCVCAHVCACGVCVRVCMYFQKCYCVAVCGKQQNDKQDCGGPFLSLKNS